MNIITILKLSLIIFTSVDQCSNSYTYRPELGTSVYSGCCLLLLRDVAAVGPEPADDHIFVDGMQDYSFWQLQYISMRVSH